jgi:hypothetical protein
MRMPHAGRPEQIAAILAWCVSEKNALMTGQILLVTLLEGPRRRLGSARSRRGSAARVTS